MRRVDRVKICMHVSTAVPTYEGFVGVDSFGRVSDYFSMLALGMEFTWDD